MTLQSRCWLALSLACLTLAATKHPASAKSDETGGGAPSFSGAIQPIFDANCVACHQEAGASGGLNLEDGAAYDAIVSHKSPQSALPLITPGKPEASYLMRKLEGTHVKAGGSGEVMPPTAPLDGALIAVIRDWIRAGAKSD